MSGHPEESCNFCLRSAAEVTRLLGGPTGARICDDCVGACGKILADPATPFPGFDDEDDAQLLARLGPANEMVAAAAAGLHALVDLLRQRKVSWERIGAALGVSRQAAWERFD